VTANHELATDEATGAESFRPEGAGLLVAALLSLLFMTFHPSVHRAGAADVAAAIRKIAVAGRVVHAALIATLVVTAWGVLGLARRLGFERATVRLGALALLVGSCASIAAATLSGFVVTGLADGAGSAGSEALAGALQLCHVANQAFAQVGVVATAGALCLLSCTLLRRRGPARAVAVYGIVQAVVIVAALAVGVLRLDVHGMLGVVAAQAVWHGAVGVLLLRRES
jgi:hypothetical protein